MASVHVVVLISLLAYALSVPLRDSEPVTDSSAMSSVHPAYPLVQLDSFKMFQYLYSKNKRIKRSKECGVMCGNMCPQGTYKVDSGFCLPCQGAAIPECGGAPEKDYDDI